MRIRILLPLFLLVLSSLSLDAQEFRHEGEIVEGKYTGPQTWFYPDGNKQAEVVYDQSGRAQSFTTWFEDGSLEDEVKCEALTHAKMPYDDKVFSFTDSGLGYMIISKNQSLKFPEPGQKVVVQYEGYLQDGGVFDSSYRRGKPFKFKFMATKVIPGFDEAVSLLHIGDSGFFKVPAHLGYGSRAVGVIPPHSTLIYKIELLEAK